MDWQIAGILAQDGVTSGAVYALLALALVLVFSVTRVIFIPQGEFVAFGALTLAAIQTGGVPQLTWLVMGMGALAFLMDAAGTWRIAGMRHGVRPYLPNIAANLLLPVSLHLLARTLPLAALPQAVQALLAMLIVIPMGPMIYRIAYQRLSGATTLVLLIVSVAVHVLLTGIGLLVFGAEGSRTAAFSDAAFELGGLRVTGQSIWVLAISALLIFLLYLYFDRTLSGKALRATAVNRLGARIVGIGANQAGKLAFTLAAAIGALSGVLIGPITTVFYDSGFLIGLKGFVGAIVGGLVSYPAAAAGAVLVGLLESYSSFWASAFKEVIVFTLIIPVLLWRSLTGKHAEEEH
ncbi:branched-chain amino acid ABC transporter permease [Noviherbaspirillum aridicola]|uniref:Branched-chain amino acid ABC transporter permease n=1 Tax=Noviherbaspirillum aridicola TaxID=2849687 RepID=A0ABQ4PZE2_9BURK|nr:branched-chain amino acid ABC transporter permease [Noviherbaspirillum aridicola]GIZ50195.1 branched-chain amino acid ABC transporter permease [Noviherbaspirillum aridicola]